MIKKTKIFGRNFIYSDKKVLLEKEGKTNAIFVLKHDETEEDYKETDIKIQTREVSQK